MLSRPGSFRHDFAQRAASIFLKLAVLYGLYALQNLVHGFRSSVPVPDRIVMSGGSASIVLSLLVPPAVFAAALSSFEPFDETAPGSRKHQWSRLVAMALGAWLLSGFGPIASDLVLYSMRTATGQPSHPVNFTEVMVVVPVAIGFFVLLSGVAGALVGQRTRRLPRWRRQLVRWVACLALVAVFWFPVMGAGALVDRYGVSVAWLLLLLPLTVPLVATWRLLRMQGYELRDLLPAPGRATRSRPLDVGAMDRLITAAVKTDDREGGDDAGREVVLDNEAEAEMFQFLTGLRRALVRGAALPEHKVDEIVRAALDAAPAPAPAPTQTRRRVWVWPLNVNVAPLGEFGVSWACLTVGLLFFGLVGGASPNAGAAAVLGLLGSAATVLLAKRRPAPLSATASA